MNELYTSLAVQYASINDKQLSCTHPIVHSKQTNNASNVIKGMLSNINLLNSLQFSQVFDKLYFLM